MSETLIISHSVYLTPEERKILTREPTTIETVGISVPANTKDLTKKLTEVFVRYLITTEATESDIELMPDGYRISFSHKMALKTIAHHEEGGADWLMFTLEKDIDHKGQPYHLIHQIILKDVSAQERTTVCDQLGHFLMEQPPKK